MVAAQTVAVTAAHMGEVFERDLELSLPSHPRLIPELVVVPHGEDGVLFVGAKDTQLLRGRSARALLPRLLSTLDGRRSLEELEAAAAGVAPEALRSVVALLYSRGLLEDGTPGTPSAELADVDAFAGRYIDVTRANRNRRQALDRLAAARVIVHGPPGTAESLAEQLRACGIGRAGLGQPATGADLVIVVCVGRDDDPEPALADAWRAGVPALHVRLGASETQIGPLFLPGTTCCYPCFVALHGRPAGDAPTGEADLWAAVAALDAFHYLSRLAGPKLHLTNTMLRYTTTAHGTDRETLCAIRTPGCSSCGLPGRPVDFDDPAYAAWTVHAQSLLPPVGLLSQRDYQQHYSATNMGLSSEKSESFWTGATIALPSAAALAGPPPWRAGSSDDGAAGCLPVTGADVANLLWHVTGPHPRRAERRMAPTGGNLGSVELFVATAGVDGLPDGRYHYHGPTAALEELCAPGEADLFPFSPLVVVGMARLDKVGRKYGALGYRLAYLDAGIALSYLEDVATVLGLQMAELPDIDDDALINAFHLSWTKNRYVPTFVAAVARGEEIR